jgi:hypothetical protein
MTGPFFAGIRQEISVFGLNNGLVNGSHHHECQKDEYHRCISSNKPNTDVNNMKIKALYSTR